MVFYLIFCLVITWHHVLEDLGVIFVIFQSRKYVGTFDYGTVLFEVTFFSETTVLFLITVFHWFHLPNIGATSRSCLLQIDPK